MKKWILLVILLVSLSGCTFVLPTNDKPEYQSYSYSVTVPKEPIIVQGTLVDEYNQAEPTLYIKDVRTNSVGSSITIYCVTTARAKIDTTVIRGEYKWFTLKDSGYSTDHAIMIGNLTPGYDYTLVLQATSEKGQSDRSSVHTSTGFNDGEISQQGNMFDVSNYKYNPNVYPYIK